jgi:hypothetical protein
MVGEPVTTGDRQAMTRMPPGRIPDDAAVRSRQGGSSGPNECPTTKREWSFEMQEAQRNTLVGRNDGVALRLLVTIVILVAIAEAVVIGMLLLRPVASATADAQATTPVDQGWFSSFRAAERAPDTAVPVDPNAWFASFRTGERAATLAEPDDREAWIVVFRADERSSRMAVPPTATDWLLQFRTTERQPIDPVTTSSAEWRHGFRLSELTGS